MFNKKKIQELENRIIKLEEKLEEKDKVRIISSVSSEIPPYITDTGGVKSIGDYWSIYATKYEVSTAYIIDKILDHLKLDISFISGTEDKISLVKMPRKK